MESRFKCLAHSVLLSPDVYLPEQTCSERMDLFLPDTAHQIRQLLGDQIHLAAAVIRLHFFLIKLLWNNSSQ